MKKILVLLALSLLVLSVAGCTAGPNPLEDTPDEEGEIAGFWQGLWQGFISPITWVISLFSETINVYEVHNNGTWYNLGFLGGASLFFGGGAGGGYAGRRRRRR